MSNNNGVLTLVRFRIRARNRGNVVCYLVTYYIDLGRWVDKPVPTLRTQFQYWLEKALWHRPSVLVFDNMDKLLATELEASVLDPSVH